MNEYKPTPEELQVLQLLYELEYDPAPSQIRPVSPVPVYLIEAALMPLTQHWEPGKPAAYYKPQRGRLELLRKLGLVSSNEPSPSTLYLPCADLRDGRRVEIDTCTHAGGRHAAKVCAFTDEHAEAVRKIASDEDEFLELLYKYCSPLEFRLSLKDEKIRHGGNVTYYSLEAAGIKVVRHAAGGRADRISSSQEFGQAPKGHVASSAQLGGRTREGAWFERVTNGLVRQEQLKKAAQRKKLTAYGTRGTNLYDIEDVGKYEPKAFEMITAAYNREVQAGQGGTESGHSGTLRDKSGHSGTNN